MQRHSTPHIYSTSLALMTDLYELTMAYGYWSQGMVDKEAVFHLFFRRAPFHGGFTIAAGLEYVIDYINHFTFDSSDLEYLATLRGSDNEPYFTPDFLEYLKNFKCMCDVDAVPEGTIVYPQEPLLRIKGPLIHCQLLESSLLNIINFSTLIATKSARVCLAAQGDTVFEFGLRRAQGIDGSVTASRAAYIGGCHATSNVLAGKLFGIPVRGTHSHSWVMAFEDEEESFMAFARAQPGNSVFLVDTYDTVEGVKKAIRAGKWLESIGKKMLGVRLDSGDLAYLSVIARKLLDDAGMSYAQIFASNELDEMVITDLKRQGAKIVVWGVGTNLVTAKDQPSLDGVYKLSAVRNPGQEWDYRLKLSEQMVKISNPGILQVRRYTSNGESIADAIFDSNKVPTDPWVIVDPMDVTRQKKINPDWQYQDLLVPIYRQGECIYTKPSIHEIRENTAKNLATFHDGVKRFLNPHQYIVGMEKFLYEKKVELIKKVRV